MLYGLFAPAYKYYACTYVHAQIKNNIYTYGLTHMHSIMQTYSQIHVCAGTYALIKCIRLIKRITASRFTNKLWRDYNADIESVLLALFYILLCIFVILFVTKLKCVEEI